MEGKKLEQQISELIPKPVELIDFSSENEEQNETDKMKAVIAEAQNQYSKLKSRRTAKHDDNRIQFVYGKGEDGIQEEVKSGSFTQNIKSTIRRPERRDTTESSSHSEKEPSANVKFVTLSGSSSSYKASVQQKDGYQNYQNSSSLGAAAGSLKSSLKTSSLSLKFEPDDRPDGGSDLRILTESELEELTLKEANKAAGCTDRKSTGADTILCIDTSSSMEGKKFQQITEFIESFMEGIENVAVENSLEENIAVVSFGNETRVVQHLTNDYSKIRDAVESLELGGPSPIIIGLLLCMSAIYNRGGVVTFRERKIFPRIILLTDGGVTDQRIFSGLDTIVKQGGTKKEVWHKLMEFAERIRTHADPRNLVCVPIGEDADMTLLEQLVNTAGGTLVQPEDVQKISHHFLINTVVAKVIHDGALRGPELSDDELKQKIQATEGAGDFTEAEVEETLAMIKRDSEQRAQGGATRGLDSSITETKEMPPIGSRVRRGPDWRWDNQDDNLPGTVVARKARGYLTVEWDNGNRGKYRYGAESGAKDVRMVDEPRMLPPGMMVALGVRARRGTDWKWGPQDGGEGSSGVIFKVEDSGIVHVRWDNEKRGNYRFGLFGKYDVEVCPQCIVTEGATGLSDGGSPQESREKTGQWQWQDKDGRWRDHAGETSDKIEHVYQTRHGKGTVVVERENEKYRVIPEKKCQRNVSTGAEDPIRRIGEKTGQWQRQDKDGRWRDHAGETSDKIEHVYQTRHGKGTVVVERENEKYRVIPERKCQRNVSTGAEYPIRRIAKTVEQEDSIILKMGDKVKVNLTVTAFQQLQDNTINGGWNDGMEQCVGKIGTIVRVLHQGQTCRVQYTDCTTWTIDKMALTRIHRFAPGDAITVLSDYMDVRLLHIVNGSWNDNMKSVLGANGRFEDVNREGNVVVTIDGKNWTFNPVCIMPLDTENASAKIPPIQAETSTTRPINQTSVSVNESLAKLGNHLKEKQGSHILDFTNFIQAVTEGNIETVKTIIEKHPRAVKKTVEGKAALQIASYEGHLDIVKFLLESKADPNFQDSEGDSSLHFSAHGNEPNAMKELIKRKANVNVVNKKKQTPLHIAVGVNGPECVNTLLKAEADPSQKDCDGDTPMHYAIAQKSEILKNLLESPLAIFTQTNGRGFNVLQWAVMNNFKLAADIILKKNPEIVNDKMAEGVSALHLAALNNCLETANVLVKSGHCDVNAIDKTKRTPLIMSVSQGHQQMMELLIAAGSNVNAQDIDGNTALHVAMLIQALPTQQEMNIEIICALLEAKADVNIRNQKELQPLDLAEDEKTRKFMISLAQKAKADALQTTRKGIGIPAEWEPMTIPYHFKRVLLSSDSGGMMQREYRMVAKKFIKTLSRARILQIERVQNEYSWETYQLTRRQTEHRYGGIGCANEKDLFHGTVIKHINTICKNNFDFRLAGKRVGTLLGYGTYFARDAKYSDCYAEADRDGNKYMFLAKVLCGKWNRGNPDYKRPPPIDSKDIHSDLYDSCVDNVENPKVFCIYDKNQYYPHYLIKYTSI